MPSAGVEVVYSRGASHGAAPHPANAFPSGHRLCVLWTVAGAIPGRHTPCAVMPTAYLAQRAPPVCGPKGSGLMRRKVSVLSGDKIPLHGNHMLRFAFVPNGRVRPLLMARGHRYTSDGAMGNISFESERARVRWDGLAPVGAQRYSRKARSVNVAGFSTQPREPEDFDFAISQLRETRCTFDLQFQHGRLDMDVRGRIDHHLPPAPLPSCTLAACSKNPSSTRPSSAPH